MDGWMGMVRSLFAENQNHMKSKKLGTQFSRVKEALLKMSLPQLVERVVWGVFTVELFSSILAIASFSAEKGPKSCSCTSFCLEELPISPRLCGAASAPSNHADRVCESLFPLPTHVYLQLLAVDAAMIICLRSEKGTAHIRG